MGRSWGMWRSNIMGNRDPDLCRTFVVKSSLWAGLWGGRAVHGRYATFASDMIAYGGCRCEVRRSRFWEMTRLGSLYKIVKIFFKRLDFSEIRASAANYGPPIIPHEKLKVNTFFMKIFCKKLS